MQSGCPIDYDCVVGEFVFDMSRSFVVPIGIRDKSVTSPSLPATIYKLNCQVHNQGVSNSYFPPSHNRRHTVVSGNIKEDPPTRAYND